jgi:uncharacterized alkaline shock family protein YloU
MLNKSTETVNDHFKFAKCSITYEVTIPAVHLKVDNHIKIRLQKFLELDTEI